MGRSDYRICKGCGARVFPPQTLSHTRLCAFCAERRCRETFESISAHKGEPFDYWRLRMAASVGAIPLDLVDTWLEQRQSRD